MSNLNRQEFVDRLVSKWCELRRAGQELPPEELLDEARPFEMELGESCWSEEELLRQLQRRIDEIRAGERAVRTARPTLTAARSSANGSSANGSSQGAIADTEEPQTVPSAILETAADLHSTVTYKELYFHAEGGIGEVYRAVDSDLRRSVAVKFIKAEQLTNVERRQRFLMEAEITGQLDHPGVAPVYALGATEDGRPFYTMRFVRGETLERAITALHSDSQESGGAAPQTLQQLLRRLVAVSRTVAYAHQRRIVNCDIKPLNIMLGRYGETVLLDWGEASSLDESNASFYQHTEGPLSANFSSSQHGGGTLPYMAPERFDPQAAMLPTIDIYSLGACLYKILTGQDAFQAPTREQLVQRIREGEYLAPSRIRSGVPKPLESICRKALANDARRRYTSATEFANDLERWLDDEPVQAHREDWPARLSRWTRRHKTSAGMLAVIVIAFAVLATGAAGLLGRAWSTASEARTMNLHLSARSVARLVARDIEYRWRAMEFEAAHSEFVAAVQAASSSRGPVKMGVGPQKTLQTRLEKIFEKWTPSTQANSMLVLDRDGVMVARVPGGPDSARVIGQSFAFRDYFHGQDRDYTDDEMRELDGRVKPYAFPHVSVPLISQINGRLRLQFSVPIKDAEEEVIGVLGMAVEISNFDISGGQPDRPIVLVDLRKTSLSNETRDNLIVHHPQLKQGELRSITAPSILAQLRGLVDNPWLSDGSFNAGWTDHYEDPVNGRVWNAAFAPVGVRQWIKDSERKALPIVVIAQEPHD